MASSSSYLIAAFVSARQKVSNRGLRQLFENNSSRLLKQDLVARIHWMCGEHRNEWSVSLSGSWGIAFEMCNGAIKRLNLEDCR